MEQKKNIKQNLLWNTVGTTLNAFNSLFFMIIVTRINGVEKAGIFAIAFSTACILYSVGVYAGRVYQVTETDNRISDKDYIANRIITTVLMIILVLALCLVKGYDVEKILIFILITVYKAIEALFDVVHGIFQKNEKLEIAGKALFIKAICSIIVFAIVDLITKNIIISILAITIAYAIISILYDLKKVKQFIKEEKKIQKDSIIKIFKGGFYIFAISFLSMYVVNAPKYSIDNYLVSESQTIFAIIVMPATVIALAAQCLIHPYLNQILETYKNNDYSLLKKIIRKIVIIIGAFGIICTIFGYLIGTQILGFIYNVDLSEYKLGLSIIIVAATLYTLTPIYSSVLTTIRKTKSQFVIYIIVSIFAMIISAILTKLVGIYGAIVAYLIIMFFLSSIYIIYSNIELRKIFKNNEINNIKS